MRQFKLIAYTQPGRPDSTIAIAASLAQCLGVLDLEYTIDKQAARAAIQRLARYARCEFGVKLDSRANVFWAEVIHDLPEKLTTAVLTNSNDQLLSKQVKELHKQKLTVIVEATCLEEAQVGERCGADGVIIKGNEAGGRVGKETTFVLLQRCLANLRLPVWAHGGLGRHTSAACYAAGAAGIVLDTQLILCRESPLSESVKVKLAAMDGSETVCLGNDLGETYRVYARPGLSIIKELLQEEKKLVCKNRPLTETAQAWRQEIIKRVGWESLEEDLFFLGQDVAFAASLAKRFDTIGGVLQGIKKEIDDHCQSARKLLPFDEGTSLAQSHGTRYPIVQGPMARISDTPAFALEVAKQGGLPFLALSLMDPSELKSFLQRAKRTLGEHPWGVGIIGFLPPELLRQQIDIVCECRPPYALIAGGLPNQNRPLIEAGIITYMHVPSPGLLKMFLKNGDRRFIFEGRESGGHVGPYSSFILWESMIDKLLEHLSPDKDSSEYHVLFAGGIHDALSAAMVAIMAAPLAERGVRVGVQMGTAYLFTKELVDSGGIGNVYQEEALKCDGTIILEVGPGHANRCIPTPFTRIFTEEKRLLKEGNNTAEEIRFELDQMCIGRLRLASKGTPLEVTGELSKSDTVALNEDEQRTNGVFMIGDVGAIRNHVYSIEALHSDIAAEGSRRIDDITKSDQDTISLAEKQRPADIAIIGMACIMPKAPDINTYWQNILNKVNAITEIPRERWDWKLYYDENPKAKDKVYSKWGAFLDDISFNPVEYGMAPSTLSSIEPLQLLTLEVVKRALQDAGYDKRPYNREHTSVILGTGGGAGDLGQKYGIRSALPMLFGEKSAEVISNLEGFLPEWTEDSFAGILMNVAAGRVANRFDLGGVNYTVDAACASSLAALRLAVGELESGTSDMVIVGGADTMQGPFAYLCFSKTLAISPTGQARVFDKTADGIVLGEGIGIVILKRLTDAERDGDKIYAVIKGIGSASDGRAKGLTAPRLEGQILTMNRAYHKANIVPTTVGLIEAHGTGTVIGDKVEIQALDHVFNNNHMLSSKCAIGSVKSMVGHTKNASGVAGLIKATLALHHKVLPPTLSISKPNAELNLPESSLYANTETRPWINSAEEYPRRAGVSGFGFGGTNFHVVLEEYTDDYLRKHAKPEAAFRQLPIELLLFSGSSLEEVLKAIEPVEKALAQGASPELGDLAYTLSKLDEQKTTAAEQAAVNRSLRLAIVAESVDDLHKKLTSARKALTASDTKQASNHLKINDPRGVYFTEQPLGKKGKVAFLFPGQGSQYVNMLKDLAIQFPEVHACFERGNLSLQHQLDRPLSSYIFPPPVFDERAENELKQALTQTNVAQPAVGAAGMAMFHLLEELGVYPSFVAGHSYGEYVALCAAGVFSEDVLMAISEARGRFIVEAAGTEPGSMAAIDAEAETTAKVLEEIEDVQIANINAPQQTVISGTSHAVQTAIKRFQAQGIRTKLMPVACAFHSPIVAPAHQRLAQFLADVELAEPELTVFSNTTARPYPHQPKAIAGLLVEHLVKPVNFVQELEAMYEAGARIFVEVGPRSVLTALADQILQGKPHLAIPSDRSGKKGLLQLYRLLGQLAAHGVPVKWSRLYRGREVQQLDLDTLVKKENQDIPTRTTWLVNGGRAIPLAEIATGERSRVEPVASAESETKTVQPALSSSQLPVFSRPPSPTVELDKRIKEPATSPHPTDGNNRVMMQFQQMMNRFLDTQKNVMQAYLQAGSGTGIPQEPAQEFIIPISQRASSELLPVKQEEMTKTETVGEEQIPAPYETPQKADINYNKEELMSRLLQIVSERTGYPPEILDPGLDLEADLGIDSIKRVEIMGNFQEKYAWTDKLSTERVTEELPRLKTLHDMVDWLTNQQIAVQEEDVTEPPSQEPDLHVNYTPIKRVVSDDATIQRFTLTAVDMPTVDQPRLLDSDLAIIITDDESGIATALAKYLHDRGKTVALVRMGENLGTHDSGSYTADLTSPEAVDQLLNIIRQRYGPIGGLVHLLPLKNGVAFEEMDLRSWQKCTKLEVKSLFYIAKNLYQDFKDAAQDSRAFLVAATKMGGTFASNSQGKTATKAGSFTPSQGGVSGLLKTISVEWPEVHVKAVDLNSVESPTTLVTKLMQAITDDDRQAEVGYPDSHRLIIEPILTPVDKEKPVNLQVDSSWVVLVTGGTQGITADVACEIAKWYQPTLLLVGRSPLPESEESEETAGLTDQKLKAALVNSLRRQNQSVTPSQVEAAYRRLLKDREIQRNIATIRSYGARVQYFQADVHNEIEFGNVIGQIYQSYGRLDGVIHGAGIIEDKLVRDKSVESFNRVFDTKVDSAFILSRQLRPDSLKFLVFFSSVAGRFGNRGQCDYTAANEVYNKLAVYLDNHWPGRVISIMWGPWARNGGMVSSELEKQFVKDGVVLVPRSIGPQKLDEELRYGQKGEAEVIIAGNRTPVREKTVQFISQGRPEEKGKSAMISWPLIGNQALLSRGASGSIEIEHCLDSARYPYLEDHKLDGKPVLPMAMALELMSEVVSLGWPQLELSVVKDLHVVKGIVIENNPKPIRVVARPQNESSPEQLDVEVSILDAEDNGRIHYRAKVELAEQLPIPAHLQAISLAEAQPFPMSIQETYDQWLFHGPIFQKISQIESISPNGMMASLIASSPQESVPGINQNQWLIDPMIVDGGLQLILIWGRHYWDMSVLPSRFAAYRRFGSISDSDVRCHMTIHPSSKKPVIHADLAFFGAEGRLLGLLQGIEGTCSRALNRLTGSYLQ